MTLYVMFYLLLLINAVVVVLEFIQINYQQRIINDRKAKEMDELEGMTQEGSYED